MADEGYITGILAGISDQNLRRILTEAFRHVLREQRFGDPEDKTKATNFSAIYQESTTAGSTSEFSFRHGMAVTPRLAIPCIDLNHVGSRTVDVEVSRVADGQRIYLKASAGSTNAPFLFLVE